MPLLVAAEKPAIFIAIKYAYQAMLLSTPFIGASMLFSLLFYILRSPSRIYRACSAARISPYNPLHNDLEAYALVYGIASLLNNLFGHGKEPFWQQAYTNLVKFIILLHKVNYRLRNAIQRL